jgi:hypothetical protein
MSTKWLLLSRFASLADSLDFELFGTAIAFFSIVQYSTALLLLKERKACEGKFSTYTFV